MQAALVALALTLLRPVWLDSFERWLLRGRRLPRSSSILLPLAPCCETGRGPIWQAALVFHVLAVSLLMVCPHTSSGAS